MTWGVDAAPLSSTNKTRRSLLPGHSLYNTHVVIMLFASDIVYLKSTRLLAHQGIEYIRGHAADPCGSNDPKTDSRFPCDTVSGNWKLAEPMGTQFDEREVPSQSKSCTV